MRVVREELLSVLEVVKYGLSKRETVEQSSKLVFSGGRVTAYNEDVYATAPSPLGDDVTGAVAAGELLETLRDLKDETLEAEVKNGCLCFRGRRDKFRVRLDEEVVLQVDRSAVPPEEWLPFPDHFLDALSLAVRHTGTDPNQFALTCVHLHMRFVEACQPPGTLIATSDGGVPIEMVRPGQRVWSYSYQKSKSSRSLVGANRRCRSSFRHGHTVTRVGQRQYVGDLVVLTTGAKTTRYTTDHECLVRLDSAFYAKYVVYLLRRGAQFRVGVTGPRMWKSKWKNQRREGRADVRVRMSIQKADSCWVLACFDTEAEALAEEKFIVARYGIPDMLFRVRPGEHRSGNQERCDAFWTRFGDNLDGAKTCLRAYGRDVDHPFAERNGSLKSHIGDAEIKIRACNLMTGMKVLDAERCKNGKVTDECWVTFTLSRETYNGPVYSMTVDKSHTYVGDGIVTHNCDNFRLVRYKVDTGLPEPVFVRGEAARSLPNLGMVEYGLTPGWLFFRNPKKIVYACRRHEADYPDFAPFLRMGVAEELALPKDLDEVVKRAARFTKTRIEDDLVRVDLSRGEVRVVGEGPAGDYSGRKNARYEGGDVSFHISPKVLADLVKEHPECEVTADRIRIVGDGWKYVARLMPSRDRNGSGGDGGH